MTKVRILHGGGVGEYKAGEVVEKPSPGLLFMAEHGTRNAADGQLVVEFVEEDEDDENVDIEALRAEAKELGIKGYAKMKAETLLAAIADVKSEDGQRDKDGDGQTDDTQKDGE